MRILVCVVAIVLAHATAPSARRETAALTALERQRLVAHAQTTEQWLRDEVSGLSPAQLAFRPAPTAWSIFEVLDHLVVVAPIYWADLQAAVRAPAGTTKSSQTDAEILWYGIDRTDREQAIPSERPVRTLRDVRTGLDAIRDTHARLITYIQTTDAELRSHIVARQGCDAYQWALLIVTHEQRHIHQIREIKASSGFPAR